MEPSAQPGASQTPPSATALPPDPDLRFSLANERTFLAWSRTAVAIIATGLLVAKLIPASSVSALQGVLGGVLIFLGTAMEVGAFRNYRRTDAAIRRGEPIRPTALPWVMFTIVFAGALAILLTRL